MQVRASSHRGRRGVWISVLHCALLSTGECVGCDGSRTHDVLSERCYWPLRLHVTAEEAAPLGLRRGSEEMFDKCFVGDVTMCAHVHAVGSCTEN